MRVLHLISSLGGGGAERQVVLLARALARLGVDVHVAFQHAGPNLPALLESGATAHAIPLRGNHDARLPAAVCALLRRLRPDVVHTWLTSMDVVGGLAASLVRVPWLVSERTSPDFYARRFSVKDRTRRALGRRAWGVVGNSEAGLEYWRGVIPPHRRFLVPNAVPLDEIQAAPALDRASLPLPADAPLIVYAGRFAPEKNIRRVAAAIRRITSTTPAVALLCGEGPERRAVESELAEGIASGRVLVTGYRDDLWSVLRAADALLLLSRFEGSPNVVLEAMACGCPVVLSDIVAHRAIADGDSACFVSPDSTEAVVAGLRQTLGSAGSARRVEARRRAGRFAPPLVARMLLDVYTQAGERSEIAS